MSQSLSLLVASESSAARENLRSVFSKEGAKVTTVMSWRQTEEVLDKEGFNAVIVDSKLADCSGTEFLQNLKKQGVKTGPQLLMAEEIDGKLLGLAKEAAVSFVLLKPIVLARVEGLVRFLVEVAGATKFTCEVFPGGGTSTHKLGLAFMSARADFEKLRDTLRGWDICLLPAIAQTRQGLQYWGALKPEVTVVEKELSDSKSLDLLKALRCADKNGECVVIAREVEPSYLKEVAGVGIKHCLIFPLRPDTASNTFAKFLTKKVEIKIETPVEKPKEEVLAFPAVKALLVEANSEGIANATRFLKEMQFEVASVADSKNAISAWKSMKPGLVLSNFELGGGDNNGLELLRAIRKEDNKTPFIMTSVEDCWKQVEEAQHLGCAGWLQKPYEKEELQRAVKKAMDTRTGVQWIKGTKE